MSLRLKTGRLFSHDDLLLVFSACLFATAFLVPQICGWLILFALVPLVARMEIVSSALLSGFVWGFLFFGIHLYAICYGVFIRVGYQAGVITTFFLILYAAVQTAIWFVCAYGIQLFVSHIWIRRSWWVLITYLYFVWMDTCAFSVLGMRMGHPLVYPLLPLLNYSAGVAAIALLGKHVCLLGVLMWSVFVADSLARKPSLLFGALVLMSGVVLYSPLQRSTPDEGALSQIAYASAHNEGTPLDVAQNIHEAIIDTLDEHPDAKYVIFPESQFPFPLDAYPEFVEMWSENSLQEGVRLILGAYYTDGDWMRNSYCVIQDGKIIDCQPKKKLMPFIEYTPYKWTQPFFNTPFASDKPKVCPTQEHTRTQIPFHIEICSEFFFSSEFYNQSAYPTIAMVNDGWFFYDYMATLMRLKAHLIALETRKNIIYVGYKQGEYLQGAFLKNTLN